MKPEQVFYEMMLAALAFCVIVVVIGAVAYKIAGSAS
jgi:hypothetical protein